MYDTLVFMGRFQPFHNGHEAVIRAALNKSKEVIVLVGSSFASRDGRNPFTFEERRGMIKAVFPQDSVKVAPIVDYPYNDTKWLAGVQSAVYATMSYSPDARKIGLIGHAKDATSYYLKMFPKWGSVSVPNVNGINATDIRFHLFKEIGGNNDYNMKAISPIVADYLHDLIVNKKPDVFLAQKAEWDLNILYKKQFVGEEYPRHHTTTDAVVTQSGHALLIQRKHSPGMGLMALPGGFLHEYEPIIDGVLRELREETKLKVPTPVMLGSIKGRMVCDLPYRSVRGRTISHAFHFDLGNGLKLPKVMARDDAKKAEWIPFHEIKREEMFEDHYGILDSFLNIG